MHTTDQQWLCYGDWNLITTNCVKSMIRVSKMRDWALKSLLRSGIRLESIQMAFKLKREPFGRKWTQFCLCSADPMFVIASQHKITRSYTKQNDTHKPYVTLWQTNVYSKLDTLVLGEILTSFRRKTGLIRERTLRDGFRMSHRKSSDDLKRKTHKFLQRKQHGIPIRTRIPTHKRVWHHTYVCVCVWESRLVGKTSK